MKKLRPTSTGDNNREQDRRWLRLEQFAVDLLEGGVALGRQLQYVGLMDDREWRIHGLTTYHPYSNSFNRWIVWAGGALKAPPLSGLIQKWTINIMKDLVDYFVGSKAY